MFRLKVPYFWYDTCPANYFCFKDRKKSVNHNQEVFVINIWGILTTCFGPKGLSSANTYIQHYYAQAMGNVWVIFK